MDFDDMELQVAEFQYNSAWGTKFTELRKQLELLEHDPSKKVALVRKMAFKLRLKLWQIVWKHGKD
jgi:hypothetical protein